MALTLVPPPSSNVFASVLRGAFALSMDQSQGPRVSLPSISSLIEAANDAAEAGTERPNKEDSKRVATGSQVYHQHHDRQLSAGSPRSRAPPTPPPAAGFDYARHSPINSSPTFVGAPQAPYAPQPFNAAAPEHYSSRASIYPPLPDESAHLNQPQYRQPPIEPYAPDALARNAATTYPELPDEKASYTGLTHQRSLPETFPPPPPPVPQSAPAPAMPPIDPQMGHAQAWQYHQHHHSFPQNTTVPYQPTQERYICNICSRPFSRPSSLKIHTHSHTGEKPYKCKNEGCDKWFSVKSNAKRHEKGCHAGTGENISTGGNSPSAA